MDQTNELLELSGTVSSVIFKNEENGYTVLRMTDGNGEPVTVVGCFPYAFAGESLIASGRWITHPSYGKQFKCEFAQRIMPDSEQHIYAFLAGGSVKGIGPATASLLVNAFGEKTLEVLENVVATSDNLWLRWASILHDVGKTKSKRWDPAIGWTFYNHNIIGAKMVPVIFRRLMLPLDMKMKYVQKLVDLHMRPIAIADDEVTDSAVRRLLNDAGEDIDDLMTLCEADITSKNEVRKKIFLENFRMVREKLADLKEKDYVRLLQPVIDGNEIMELFHLKPSREVGVLKQYLKDAVLDNHVENEREPLMQLLMTKAKEMKLI